MTTAVQEFLNETMRIGRCSSNTGRSAIETQATADQVDSGRTEEAIDGIGFLLDDWSSGRRENAK